MKSNLLSLAAVALFFFGVALGLAAAPETRPEIKPAIFISQVHGFSISPPAFPAAEKASETIATFFAPPEKDLAPNLGLQVVHVKTTPDEFIRENLEQLKKMNYNVLGIEQTRVDGKNAIWLDFTGSAGELPLHFLSMAILDDARIITVTATTTTESFKKQEPLFRQSMKTFKFLK